MKKLKTVLGVILFFFFSHEVLAQSEGLTPLQVSQLKQVNEITLAPSGEEAFYTLRVQANPLEENKPAEYELYYINMSSGESIPYLTTISVSNINYRPNHDAVTFLGKENPDDKTILFEMSLSGGEARPLLSFKTSIADYSWAPDGNHIAFMASEPKEGEESPLPYEPEIYEENLTQRRGYVTNLNKQGHQPHQLQVEGSIYQMHWHPDGKRLAVAVAPSPRIDDYYMNQQVMIVDHHGKKVLAKVEHEGKLGQVEWSPNGSHLAMIAAGDINDPIDGRLFVVSEDGGEPTQLQPNYEGMFEQFEWSSDSTIHYLTSEGVWSTFGSISITGSEMDTVIGKGGPNLSGFQRADNGTTLFTADSSAHPSELYQYNPEASDITRLTSSNPWLDSLQLSRQEVVSWEAKDGTVLQGLLVYPIDYRQGQQYPLITVVHGGPESHYNDGWVTDYSDPGQLGAAQNYFVFYPNYRGSTGRGESFAKSSQGDLAGAEFDDILAGVTELKNSSVIDSSKVGVTGGSYGGYATAWMSTRYSDHFAAGVMFVGVSNNISKWGTSDIPEELYYVHAREWIWDDYQSFLERSPIYYADQAKTPLLIMHGKEDTRVSPSQSYELYRHIKTRTDTPVRLVLYPEEGHGNTNSTARYDYTKRMMRWFGQYLKGEDPDQQPDAEVDVENVSIQSSS